MPLKSVLVEVCWRTIRGGYHNETAVEEQREESLKDHRVGNVCDLKVAAIISCEVLLLSCLCCRLSTQSSQTAVILVSRLLLCGRLPLLFEMRGIYTFCRVLTLSFPAISRYVSKVKKNYLKLVEAQKPSITHNIVDNLWNGIEAASWASMLYF